MGILNADNKMINSRNEKSNTGWKGIHFDKERGKFEAQVVYRSKQRRIINMFYVGSYETLKEAITSREEVIKKLF